MGVFDEDRMAAAVDIPACGCREREGRKYGELHLNAAVELMTVSTMTMRLLPILWSTATGSDLMKRIAAPMVGGLTSSFVIELVVYPVLCMIWRQRENRHSVWNPSCNRTATAP